MAKAAKQSSKALEQAATDFDSVDRIRDIIFGRQMRDYEERFSRLEERLMQEAEELRKEVQFRFDELESSLDRQARELGQQILEEQRSRDQTVEDVKDQIRGLDEDLGKRLAGQGSSLEKAVADLDKTFQDQKKKLAADFTKKIERLARQINDEIRSLRMEKTDRAALAAVLLEAAQAIHDGSQAGSQKK